MKDNVVIPEKKLYQSPKLSDYGDVKELTRTTTNGSNSDYGSYPTNTS